jgi:hypothetical protein
MAMSSRLTVSQNRANSATAPLGAGRPGRFRVGEQRCQPPPSVSGAIGVVQKPTCIGFDKKEPAEVAGAFLRASKPA